MCEKFKKILKIVGIIAAICAAIAGIYYVVTKLIPCKNKVTDDDESDYVSCSCCDKIDPVQVDAE